MIQETASTPEGGLCPLGAECDDRRPSKSFPPDPNLEIDLSIVNIMLSACVIADASRAKLSCVDLLRDLTGKDALDCSDIDNAPEWDLFRVPPRLAYPDLPIGTMDEHISAGRRRIDDRVGSSPLGMIGAICESHHQRPRMRLGRSW
jgi:hypothetical protein